MKYKNIFKNHVATLTDLGSLQILNFKEPGKREYELEYIFKDNMVFITGDCKDAVFNCTWKTSWDCMSGWNITEEYFAEKMSAHSSKKYIFDNHKAITDANEYFRQHFLELDDNEYQEMFESLYSLQTGFIVSIEENYDVEMYSDEIANYGKIENTNFIYDLAMTICYAHRAETIGEFVTKLGESDVSESIIYWATYENTGMVINPYIELYLAGLQESYNQLKNNK